VLRQRTSAGTRTCRAVHSIPEVMCGDRKDSTVKTQHLTLPIEDLRCGGALIVERALVRTPGVVRVYVNPATEMAYIEFEPTATDIGHLITAIESAGFHIEQSHVR
jgi:copper chaperone CopZ